MSETAVAIWVIAVFMVMLNGCAAGVVAILHAGRSKTRRGARVVIAAIVTAFLPASLFLPVALLDPTLTDSEGPLIMGLAFAMVFVLSLVVSLPGALIVARKLEQPGEEFRSFE